MSEQQKDAEEEKEKEPVAEAADDLGAKPSTDERTMYTVDEEELA